MVSGHASTIIITLLFVVTLFNGLARVVFHHWVLDLGVQRSKLIITNLLLNDASLY